jgi:hypothetical protein
LHVRIIEFASAAQGQQQIHSHSGPTADQHVQVVDAETSPSPASTPEFPSDSFQFEIWAGNLKSFFIVPENDMLNSIAVQSTFDSHELKCCFFFFLIIIFIILEFS